MTNEKPQDTVGKQSASLFITLGIVGGVLLGALAVWGFYALDEGGVTMTGTSTSERTEKAPSAGSTASDPEGGSLPTPISATGEQGPSTLRVLEQTAGGQVFISGTPSDFSGWVVIYEDQKGGLGRALGAARFGPDRAPNVVPLLRETVAGRTYHAVLHTDDGDRIFSLGSDPHVRDSAGRLLFVSFMTTE